ncbi:hypothetical protein HPB48_021707 [Haemaphysalis longicornis]|uniref:TWiK family of potassium channels protein 7 n=1 Tax=Haemaphysalis longicornis TaxID=44386 RepID=A0A9J6GLV7_HAELO|nr:hypothetical protein HPB48_021707 [Haemaphysalis longicornis]
MDYGRAAEAPRPLRSTRAAPGRPMERKRSSRRHHHHHHGGGGGSGGAASAVAPPPPENRCKSCCRKFTAFLFSHVGLCALVVGYSILGAFAFRALEAPYEVEKASQVIAMRRDTVARLWEITDRLNVLYKENWTAAVSHEILDFQARLIAAVKDGYDGKEIGTGGQQWSFSGAFLYSLTVITTIGECCVGPRAPVLRFLTPRECMYVPGSYSKKSVSRRMPFATFALCLWSYGAACSKKVAVLTDVPQLSLPGLKEDLWTTRGYWDDPASVAFRAWVCVLSFKRLVYGPLITG